MNLSDGEPAYQTAIVGETVAVKQLPGGGKLGIDVLGHVFGMNADAWEKYAGMSVAKGDNLRELGFVAAGEDHLADAYLLGMDDAGLHICCEGLGYQVAMGIDDFQGRVV